MINTSKILYLKKGDGRGASALGKRKKPLQCLFNTFTPRLHVGDNKNIPAKSRVSIFFYSCNHVSFDLKNPLL
jgi:hypothetical protein